MVGQRKGGWERQPPSKSIRSQLVSAGNFVALYCQGRLRLPVPSFPLAVPTAALELAMSEVPAELAVTPMPSPMMMIVIIEE
jgi:hypothetical protein